MNGKEIDMDKYTVEGFIREIVISGNGVTFTLEPTENFAFRRDNEVRMLLAVDGHDKAIFLPLSQQFVIPNFACCALLFHEIKRNHDRIRLQIDIDGKMGNISVLSISVL